MAPGRYCFKSPLHPGLSPVQPYKLCPAASAFQAVSSSSPGTGKFGVSPTSQLPWQAALHGNTCAGDTFPPASMPPACPMHKNPSPNTLSRVEGSFSSCLGCEGPPSPPMDVQPLVLPYHSLPVASSSRKLQKAAKERVQIPPFWGDLG